MTTASDCSIVRAIAIAIAHDATLTANARPQGGLSTTGTASHRTVPGRSESHPGRPSPTAPRAPPSRCSPPAAGRPRSGAPHPTSRPRRRSPRPERPPLRPAPSSSASPLAPRRLSQDLAALLHRGIENGHTIGLIGGWDLVRVDERLAVDGVREVLHAVVADALGANLRLADCCLGVRFELKVPGGCRSLQAVLPASTPRGSH